MAELSPVSRKKSDRTSYISKMRSPYLSPRAIAYLSSKSFYQRAIATS
ncbi:hypothetical protein H6G25_13950 [Dolichospermum sp. FACHB-1091]|nr:hypothetical protein [Dolichospermum sp. FACHB-1091]MBD2444270.1 hypothetical protein [Dolichospermum sp. FACHB-1091]